MCYLWQAVTLDVGLCVRLCSLCEVVFSVLPLAGRHTGRGPGSTRGGQSSRAREHPHSPGCTAPRPGPARPPGSGGPGGPHACTSQSAATGGRITTPLALLVGAHTINISHTSSTGSTLSTSLTLLVQAARYQHLSHFYYRQHTINISHTSSTGSTLSTSLTLLVQAARYQHLSHF